MPIPETQLDTWSAQGAVAASRDTYATVKGVLEAREAPYASRDFKPFLQGSYFNDTNVRNDSDVDVVIRLDETFYHNIDALEEAQQRTFHQAFPAASYSFDTFKNDVTGWLQHKFGRDQVKPGTKAIFIKGQPPRRDGDVLVAAQYRHYWRYQGPGSTYVEGICFWDKHNRQIINYPKLHADNCTTKHQNTSSWFKPTVRVCKNMRNRMIQDGVLADGVAPSYFIEGMLHNVPSSLFGGSFQNTFVSAFNWIEAADKSKLECANGMYFLVRDSAPECWKTDDFNTYLRALKNYWNQW